MFNSLIFKEHPNHPEGIHAKIFFLNGYGASIVKTHSSYGGEDGLWELAVMKGTEGDNTVCYSSLITDDVIGHLTEHGVSRLLAHIKNLPPSESIVPRICKS